jgi:hypothetical protein
LHAKTAKRTSSRAHEPHGWKTIVISGNPRERGYAHGRILYRELKLLTEFLPFFVKTDFKTTLEEYVDRCNRMLHQTIKTQYREYYDEMIGISEGALSRGIHISLETIIAWNAFLSMYAEYTNGSSENASEGGTAPSRCSAFIATGNATKHGDIVMAHNTHCNYVLARLSNIIVYMYPEKGAAFCMQTCPGLICSSMDWFLCDNGMIGCETTITGVKYKPEFGAPYFCRIRDCMQYGKSLDEYAEIMIKNNSGDYACSWLFGDTRTGEIMLFEIGLKRHNIEKTKDGVFYGMNSAIDNSLRVLETKDTDTPDLSTSSGARSARLDYLLKTKYANRIDISNAKRILADHYDVYLNRNNRGCRSICKHTDLAGDSVLHKNTEANNEQGRTSYSQNATLGACSGLHKNTEARNSRRCSGYPRNATIGACSGLHKNTEARNSRRCSGYPRNATLGACSGLKRPYYPSGAIDGKVVNTELAKRMSFYGKFGSSCDRVFHKREYLAKHPEYSEWRKYLSDLPNRPWTLIAYGRRSADDSPARMNPLR